MDEAYRKEEIVLDYEDFCGETEISPSYYAPANGDITEIIDEYEDYQWVGEMESEE